ncbi:hypothetical protein CSIV_08760 [Microbacterium sp. CSI-V]|uniref:Pr6Pr family membrane protein n=1 Tax=Microbacterium sp. CSI-V TaxID=1933777 RepID=UPI00097C05BD|nr:Pr6Pr family membrane protein [Microbacterium sp. CSI-V]ONI64797.1 hypothetical protein CSIV_08760 [Microbacterium sp. CSI-V]
MLRSPTWATVWTALRLAMAALIAAAIIAQFVSTVAGAVDVLTTVTNFFSFFTILSNTASVVVLTWAGVRFLSRGRRLEPDPLALAAALAWVSTYMVITGVVYNLLLRGLPLQPETVGWSNEIMHVWGPLFLLLDLFFGPCRRRLPWKAALGAAIFPIVWIVYTLLRANFITNPSTGAPYWYPYPFLNPYESSWGSVVGYIIGIAVTIVVVAIGAVAIGRVRGSAVATADVSGRGIRPE